MSLPLHLEISQTNASQACSHSRPGAAPLLAAVCPHPTALHFNSGVPSGTAQLTVQLSNNEASTGYKLGASYSGDAVGLGWGPGVCISNRFTGGANAVCLRTTLGEPLQ